MDLMSIAPSKPATLPLGTRGIAVGAIVVVALAPFLVFDSPVTSRIFAVAGVCLVLWLFELVPAFVPTLLLWTLIPVTLSQIDDKYSLANTLRWGADPVLGLFLGGFALGVAAEKHGISRTLCDWAMARSGGRYPTTLALIMALTAFLSMWISNIAAAALMFGAVRPLLARFESNDLSRRMLIVGVAFAANLGGMATPVGTGPNAIAIAAVSDRIQIDFLTWMFFALPLTVGLLVLLYVLLRWRAGPSGETDLFSDIEEPVGVATGNGSRTFMFVMLTCVALWLSEPFHRVPAAAVSIGTAAALFLSGTLAKEDLRRIDWSTLLLIAGGITLGRLLETSGAIHSVATAIALAQMHSMLVIFALCLLSALLSALMSNTASVAMLIPLAGAMMPEPSIAVLVAISASFGMMFVISTPQNAMAHGEGGLPSSDLFYPGLVILIVGCLLVTLTGRLVLNLAGIP